MAALNQPHWHTVTPELRSLMQFLGQQPFMTRFYLAGGTALALQLGHRRSIDLDFFSETDNVDLHTRHEILQIETRQAENVHLASCMDIGLMKCDALITRGSRKDFYDLYFLGRKIPFDQLLLSAEKKYGYYRDFPLTVIERMVAFDNADRDVQPILFEEVSWEQVKAFFIQEASRLGRAWLQP